MSRLRYNNLGGTLGAALTGTGTTITFGAALTGIPTIAAPDYLPLLLEPPAGATPSANFEIVWLTAYTAGATTGTILRGQEGTAAVAHASGVTWGHAPTAQDFKVTPPARAYRNAALSLTGNVWNKIPVDTLNFSPDGSMDVATNHRYVAPAAGYYLVIGQVEVAAVNLLLGLYKNGALVSRGSGEAPNTDADAVVSDVLLLAVGDYVELYAYVASSVALYVLDGSHANYLNVVPLGNGGW